MCGTLFSDNFLAKKFEQCVTLTTYLALDAVASTFAVRPMLMARDELLPSYLDTAARIIHSFGRGVYNIRALLNIKNVTLQWLIHLCCKHECVSEVSFLICGERVSGGGGGGGGGDGRSGSGVGKRQSPLVPLQYRWNLFARSHLLNYINRRV